MTRPGGLAVDPRLGRRPPGGAGRIRAGELAVPVTDLHRGAGRLGDGDHAPVVDGGPLDKRRQPLDRVGVAVQDQSPAGRNVRRRAGVDRRVEGCAVTAVGVAGRLVPAGLGDGRHQPGRHRALVLFQPVADAVMIAVLKGVDGAVAVGIRLAGRRVIQLLGAVAQAVPVGVLGRVPYTIAVGIPRVRVEVIPQLEGVGQVVVVAIGTRRRGPTRRHQQARQQTSEQRQPSRRHVARPGCVNSRVR